MLEFKHCCFRYGLSRMGQISHHVCVDGNLFVRTLRGYGMCWYKQWWCAHKQNCVYVESLSSVYISCVTHLQWRFCFWLSADGTCVEGT
jgi:hypothetical protein